jgi:mitochondrial fission 1 protein
MREHQVEGVRLLQGVYPSLLSIIKSYRVSTIEIYRAEPARRRECLYYLALGHYKMGNFEEARKFNGVSNIMLEVEIRAYSDPPEFKRCS